MFPLNSKQVFSHMLDSYLVNTSVHRMPSEDLMCAFDLARRYSMRELADTYAHALADRLSAENFTQVIKAQPKYSSYKSEYCTDQ